MIAGQTSSTRKKFFTTKIIILHLKQMALPAPSFWCSYILQDLNTTIYELDFTKKIYTF